MKWYYGAKVNKRQHGFCWKFLLQPRNGMCCTSWVNKACKCITFKDTIHSNNPCETTCRIHTSLDSGDYICNPLLKQPMRGQNGYRAFWLTWIIFIMRTNYIRLFLAETRNISANVVQGLWLGARRKTLTLWRCRYNMMIINWQYDDE